MTSRSFVTLTAKWTLFKYSAQSALVLAIQLRYLTMASSTWAMSRLSQLLPLDEESLKQILDYINSLPKDAAAEHLKNLLGDSPKALEFISSFNSRREVSGPSVAAPEFSEAPRKQPRKKKAPLNKLFPPRQPEDYGNTAGAYHKRDEQVYVGGRRRSHKEPPLANTLALSEKPDARQLPTSTTNQIPKPPPSASGPLISDLPNIYSSARSHPSSRTASPAPKTKVNLSGGPSMHAPSTALADLDSAIRTLEIQTNPSLSANTNPASRRCDCLATRHPLLAAAPNCLNCGKIICVKEGIGPCTFCSRPLLDAEEMQSMICSLREERGLEKMAANNASYRRADLSSTPRPFTTPTLSSIPDSSSQDKKALDLARQHRDRLLNYQSENARRTHIIDEAADFETPASGQSLWASPVERAKQLKRQQKVLREQEWSAKPEWEKRRVVVSVDLVGGKVVRRMGEVEKPHEIEDESSEPAEGVASSSSTANDPSKGAFAKNPLLGSLIRPTWKPSNHPPTSDENKENAHPRQSTWRRVQDDNTDNEALILDGGVYGGRLVDADRRRLGDEEHAVG